MLKVEIADTVFETPAHEVADDAVNIFGGRGITQPGMGRFVEQFPRTYKCDAILGGAEGVLGVSDHLPVTCL